MSSSPAVALHIASVCVILSLFILGSFSLGLMELLVNRMQKKSSIYPEF